MSRVGILVVLLFCAFGSAIFDCDKGLGKKTPTQNSNQIELIHLLRGDGGSWFYDNFIVPGKPVVIATSEIDRFSLPARKKWDEDQYMLEVIGEETQVDVLVAKNEGCFDGNAKWEHFTFKTFLEKSEKSSNFLMDTPIPRSLEDDLKSEELDFWKWVPCYEEMKNEKKFQMQRHLVYGSGGPQSTDIVSDPRDVMIFVAQGQRVFKLYPPNTNFTKSRRIVSRTAHTMVSKESEDEAQALTVTLESGGMLFIPFMWYRKSINSCRHVSVEVHFDVRGLLREPYYETFYEKDGNVEIFEKMRESKVTQSVECKECVRVNSKAKWKKWKRNVLIFTSLVVVVVVVSLIYFVKTIQQEEKKKKEK